MHIVEDFRHVTQMYFFILVDIVLSYLKTELRVS